MTRSESVHGTGRAETHTTWRASDAAPWLAPPSARDHKIRRGVLAARIGSTKYPGAAVLGVSAAWRTGIGMVRYVPPIGDSLPEFGMPSPAAAVLAVMPETLFGADSSRSPDAWLIGSGTDPEARSAEETDQLGRLHAGDTPLVIDAGALDTALTRDSNSATAVLTPHLGEFTRLWAATGLGPMRSRAGFDSAVTPKEVARLAARLHATVLLKGSTSTIVSPHGHAISVGPATPWLATAGTGDVLAGILGALVARHARAVQRDPEVLAALAATAALVHDLAARIASGDGSDEPASCHGAPITALDVASAVPRAISQLNSVIRLEE